jgi:hypothetical protein
MSLYKGTFEFAEYPTPSTSNPVTPLGSGTAVIGSSTQLNYINITESRNLAATDIRNQLLNITANNYIITIQSVASKGWTIGDIFAIVRIGSGTLTVSAGSGVTLNDPSGLVTALVEDGAPVAFQMIQSNSPARNTGTPSGRASRRSIHGYPAVGVRDIGAYEYGSNP